MPNLDANLSVMSQLKEMNYPAKVAAVVHYADQERTLRNMGITAVYNIYIQAGVGFAEHAFNDFDDGEKRTYSLSEHYVTTLIFTAMFHDSKF
ncbi:MAG: hypothetical protein ACI9LU_003073 [Polaribacter sp.]